MYFSTLFSVPEHLFRRLRDSQRPHGGFQRTGAAPRSKKLVNDVLNLLRADVRMHKWADFLYAVLCLWPYWNVMLPLSPKMITRSSLRYAA